MKRELCLVLCVFSLLFQKTAAGQRGGAVYTPHPQSLNSEIVAPNFITLPKNKLGVYRIEIVDNRYDVLKLGFKPEYKKAPRELKLTIPFADAIKKIFQDGVALDESTNHKLIVVIQDCWISFSASERFNILKKNLKAGLQYKIECFTARDTNYFPLKRLSGEISLYYDENISCNLLIDSMFNVLQQDIMRLKIDESPGTKNSISEIRMINYLNNKKTALPRRIGYGVYESYEDFLNQKSITDSIDIIPYKDYNDRNVVAAHLGIIKNGLVEPCSKYWGFFDGRFLFYNTGNGFFIRLFPVNGQFVFADLQQVALNTKKKSITSEAMIGRSTYDIIKDFGKAYHLFYQVNFEDGSLY